LNRPAVGQFFASHLINHLTPQKAHYDNIWVLYNQTQVRRGIGARRKFHSLEKDVEQWVKVQDMAVAGALESAKTCSSKAAAY